MKRVYIATFFLLLPVLCMGQVTVGVNLAQVLVSALKLDQSTPQTITGGVPLLNQTPTGTANLKSIVNKEYVDLAVSSYGAAYYMYDTDDPDGYKTCYLSPSPDSETYIESTSVSDDDSVGGWISASGSAPTKLLKGVYNWYLTAEKMSGNQTLRLYWKLIERKSDDSEVVIGTSTNSNELDGKANYIVPLQLSDDYIPDSGSRIVGKLFADVSGSGGAPTVRIYYRGNTASRWEIPVNTEILRDMFVPYADATSDIDLNQKDITNIDSLRADTLSTKYLVADSISADSLVADAATINGDLSLANNYLISAQTVADAGAGITGNYYSFDGVDDYGEVADDDNIDMGENDFSILLNLTLRDVANNQMLMYKYINIISPGFKLEYLTMQGVLLTFGGTGTHPQISTGILTSNIEYNLIFVADRDGKGVWYVNGEAKNLVDISGASTISNGLPLFIARNFGADASANIELNKLQIFNTALTADEVKVLYSGAPIPYKYVGASQSIVATYDTSATQDISVTLTEGLAYLWTKGNADSLMLGTAKAINDTIFTYAGETVRVNGGGAGDLTGSNLQHIGCVLNLSKSKTDSTWYDESGNDLDAAMYGTELVTNNKYGYFERGLETKNDFKQNVYSSNVSNPPTDAELDALFTSPASVGAGWKALVDDSDSDNLYIIISDGTNWFIFTGTKAT